MTRAKVGLIMTGSRQNFNGKPSRRLKYLDEQEQPDKSFKAMVLPEQSQTVISRDETAPGLELLEMDWRKRHLDGLKEIDLKGLLSHRLENYQLSPTHVTDFINLEYAGPQKFYFKTLLKFPEAPLPDAQFGNAVHETLEWLQHRTAERGIVPPASEAIEYFRMRMKAKRLTELRTALEIERGEKALAVWLRQRAHILQPKDIAEKNFHNEGVFVNDVHMSGRVDRLEIDPTTRTITVVDYKTGKTYSSWKSDPKLHRYKLQLYLYKLLIENSSSYKDYSVTKGRLEFIEPDENGKVHALEVTFEPKELEETKQLICAVWNHVHDLNFPDISGYPANLTGIKAFEQDLRDNGI
jgi:RecB family exonuclease